MSRTLRSPIVRTVVNSVQRLYPDVLADKTWDNTGLLLEAPHRADLAAARPTKNVVLLTIDLTSAVADEAIDLQSSMIVSYHPVIFRPLKALTSASTQQDSLLRLAQMGISVYSPHTAVDATVGGVNDWLADVISGGPQHELSRTVIEKAAPGPGGLPQGFESSGFGRIVVLCEPCPLAELVARVKVRLDLRHLMVANADRPVHKIALCAGSGASLFRRLANSDVDLFVTGELAHHEALTAKENGISVICCFHTNTERGFLRAVMQPKLSEVLADEWAHVAESERERKQGFEVVVSTKDRDPYQIV